MQFGIRWKLVLLISVIMAVGIIALVRYASMYMHDEVVGLVKHQLDSNLQIGHVLIDEQMPGEWNIQNDQLYKGNTLINDNFAFVDKFANLLANQATVTVFQGDTRVATNVMIEGSRAVGTQVSEEVKQRTLVENEVFLGLANVVGMEYQSIYEPIVDAKGDVIGIFYIGIPNAPFEAAEQSFGGRMLTLALLGLAVLILVLFFAVSRMTRPIVTLSNVARRIAKGDLSMEPERLRTKDEVGQLNESILDMVQSLRELILGVHASVDQVTQGSKQLASGAEQAKASTHEITEAIQSLAEGSDTQVHVTEESSRAMDEMAQGIQRIAESTSTVFEAATELLRQAEQGNLAADAAVGQMSVMRDAISSVSVAIEQLTQHSARVDEMAAVIREISAQTNLLALNAAIEAARAGEHGRGFAVVAGEVRKLAEQSGAQASQIGELVEQMRRSTGEAAVKMDDGIQEVRKSASLVEEAGHSFQSILATTRNVTSQIQEVTATSEQMSAGTQEVAASIGEIARIARDSSSGLQTVAAATEEQLASMEQVAHSSEELDRMATSLNSSVSKFKL